MPPLIRLEPQTTIPDRVPYGHADPANFGADYGALAQGAGQVHSSSIQALRAFETAQKQANDLADQVQRGTVLAQLDEAVTGDLQELRAKGLEPEQYQAQGLQLIQRRIQDAQRQIRDPLGQQKFMTEAARFGAKSRTELNTDVFKLKLGRTALEAGDAMTRLANDVVWSEDPEVKASAYAQGLAMPAQFLNAGVWSKDEAVAAGKTFLGHIEKGSIDRDARNPQMVDHVISLLSKGAYMHLPPETQSSMLDAILSKRNAAKREADQARKEEGEQKERDIVWQIRDATGPEDLAKIESDLRTLSAPGVRLFPSEKLEHFQGMIDKKKNPPEHDNPITVRTLQPRVFALKSTDAEITALEAQVNQALKDGNLTGPRHSQYLNELQQQRTRLTAGPLDKFLHDEHQQTKARMTALLRTKGPMSQDFDMLQQAITDDALGEFEKASKANGGTENPADWWDRRRPYYVARMQGMAGQYAQGVLTAIPRRYQPQHLNMEDPEKASDLIAESFRLLRQDLLDPQVRPTVDQQRKIAKSLDELYRLNQEMVALRRDAKQGTAPSSASAPAPKPTSPPAPGQTVPGRR